MNSDDRFKMLIDYLKDLKQSNETRANRKEVALWSAAVLYLGIVISMVKLIIDSNISIHWLVNIISAVAMWVLIMLFIKKQYSSLMDATSVYSAAAFLLFRLIDNPELMRSLDMKVENGYNYPNFIMTKTKECRGVIEKYRFWCWPIVPIVAIFNGVCNVKSGKIHNIKVQESVIYYILTGATALYIFMASNI